MIICIFGRYKCYAVCLCDWEGTREFAERGEKRAQSAQMWERRKQIKGRKQTSSPPLKLAQNKTTLLDFCIDSKITRVKNGALGHLAIGRCQIVSHRNIDTIFLNRTIHSAFEFESIFVPRARGAIIKTNGTHEHRCESHSRKKQNPKSIIIYLSSSSLVSLTCSRAMNDTFENER